MQRSAHPTITYFTATLALSGVYVVSGIVGLQLAAPPGYATVVWPASGVAVSALLLFGTRLWPGILIGSFLVNAFNGAAFTASGDTQSIAFLNALVIAAGSSIQALAAVGLIRRVFGPLPNLGNWRSALLFVALAAPIPCVIAPTLGISSLYVTGVLRPDSFLTNWVTWWSGDVLGIILILPLALLGPWKRDYLLWSGRPVVRFTAIMIVGLAILLGLTFYSWKFASERIYESNEAAFETLVNDSEQSLRFRLNSYGQALNAGAALFEASGEVDVGKWRSFVTALDIGKSLPGINGIGFVEEVSAEDAGRYLASARARGVEGLKIHPDPQGRNAFVITFIEPLADNAPALGLNIAFEDRRRAAATASRDAGELRITRPIELVQDRTQTPGFLLLRPVYDAGAPVGSVNERRRAFRGWIYAPFIASKFMTGLTGSQAASFDIAAYGDERAQTGDLIFATPGRADSRVPSHHITRAIDMMGQRWTVIWRSTPSFEASRGNREPALILAAGLAISSLFGMLLLFLSRQQTAIRSQVETKTRELAARDRQNRSIMDTARSAILLLDDGFCVLAANSLAERILGRSLSEMRGMTLHQLLGLTAIESEAQIIEFVRPGGPRRFIDLLLSRWDDEAGASRFTATLNDVTEIMRAEAAAREAESRFRQLADAAPVGIFETGVDGLVRFVNRAWASKLGVTQESLLGEGWRSFLPERQARELVALAKRRCSSQRLERSLSFRDVSGRRILTQTVYAPKLDEQGQLHGYVGVAIDITEQHRAEHALKESENLFRLLAENSNDMIVRIGLDGTRRYVSPASERILGYTPEELTGHTPVAAIHPDDRARAIAACQSLLTGLESPICRYRQMRKDGNYVWLEANYRLVADPRNGKPQEFIASVRDISARREEELVAAENSARLQESNRLLEMAEATAHIGHWRVDLVGGTIFWSDEVYRIHGLSRDFAPTLDSAVALYHEADRSRVSAQIAAAIDSGSSFQFRARIIRPDGDVRHVLSVGQGERAPSGEIVSLFGIFEDVTEQTVSEQALVSARDQARAAMQAKSAFLANMSHEIRTPMNGVIGFTELLLRSPLDDGQRRQAQLIADSGKAMLRLLNDLLDFSKIEAGEMNLVREPVELAELLYASLKLVEPAAQGKGLALEMSADPDLPKYVLGDGLRLRQVLLNLLGNAVKFTDHGSVSLAAGFDGVDLEITVRDTGIGIPAHRHEAVFDDFVQADASVAAKRGGTGLGLAICRRLLAMMEGEIRMESEQGVGTTFFIRLPLQPVAPSEMPQPIAPAAKRPPSSLTPMRVLLAEDHDVNQLLMQAIGEQLGLRMDIASNGVEAIASVERAMQSGEPYRLVLMDVQMPEMNGIAATQALRSRGYSPAQLPIIALTANAYADDIAACLNAGMQAHLSKPVSIDDLQHTLNKWITVRQRVGGDAAEAPKPSLSERYQARCAELLSTLDQLRGSAAIGNDDAAKVANQLHKLAGTAGIFDEGELGEMAGVLEHQLLHEAVGTRRVAIIARAFDLMNGRSSDTAGVRSENAG